MRRSAALESIRHYEISGIALLCGAEVHLALLIWSRDPELTPAGTVGALAFAGAFVLAAWRDFSRARRLRHHNGIDA